MKTLTVYPATEAALRLEHLQYGKIDPNGSIYPDDIWTKRRIKDGSLTEDASKAYGASPAKTEVAPAKVAAPVVAASKSVEDSK